MAFRILQFYTRSTNLLKANHPQINEIFQRPSINALNLLKTYAQPTVLSRDVSFFNKVPAEALWDSVTSVSNAGRRRGRAKGLMKRRDLNKGKSVGSGGNIDMIFPGLNSPISRGSILIKQGIQQRKAEEPKKEESTFLPTRKKRPRQHPLLRGWTGAKFGGRQIGQPQSIIPGEEFEGFETWILESKYLSSMTGNLGRKSVSSSFVITGNRNGLAGFAVGKASQSKKAHTAAKNKAGRRLLYIKRYQERTILHDLFGQFGTSKVFIKKMYEGYGLTGHRALKACCEALGITDIYMKTEGAKNIQNIVKAFFLALLKQRTYQEIADEAKLHIVEVSPEQGYFPKVLASPKEVKPGKVENPEEMDFRSYVLDGQVVLDKPRPLPFYTKLPSWQHRLKKLERVRDHGKVRIRLLAEHGRMHSFLTKKYPEAFIQYPPPTKKD